MDHCQPCCGLPMNGAEEANHEVVILGCGHIGCNHNAGKCIVCESEQTSRRWSGVLQVMSDSWNAGNGAYMMDDDSDDDEE